MCRKNKKIVPINMTPPDEHGTMLVCKHCSYNQIFFSDAEGIDMSKQITCDKCGNVTFNLVNVHVWWDGKN